MRTERHDNEDGSYSIAFFGEGGIVVITEYDAEGRRLREHFGSLVAKGDGSDEGAFNAIEQAAAPYLDQGYEPVDTEPGEWLRLAKPGFPDVVVTA